MKQHKVSIAAQKPCSVLVTVEAKDKKEAIKKARQAFESGKVEIEEFDIELDATDKHTEVVEEVEETDEVEEVEEVEGTPFALTQKQYEAMFEANYQEIRKAYGKKRADAANIGWSQDDNSIASKVYGEETMVVTTIAVRRGKKVEFEHEHSAY